MSDTKTPRVLSYGGGLDSFAMLLDAIDRDDKPDLVVFADVTDAERKDPGEWPSTYAHIQEVVVPLCARHDIEFKWITTEELPIRGERSLFRYMERLRMMPGRCSRMCTVAAKVERVSKYVEQRWPQGPIEVWIGFEASELNRAKNDPNGQMKKVDGNPCRRSSRFPLIERGLCRCACERLVRSKGLSVPRKSACTFCPFSKRGDFQTLAATLPKTFERVARLEDNFKGTKRGAMLTYGTKSVKGERLNVGLRVWVQGDYREQHKTCSFCGDVEATKRTGCGDLDAPLSHAVPDSVVLQPDVADQPHLGDRDAFAATADGQGLLFARVA